jgi:pimeloyl-ACP methyl ester carboxylesterase
MNMEKARKTAKLWLCIAVALMLISMIVVSVIQTDGGDVTIKELFVETDDGIALAANLYIPKAATPENPAPAIVTSHGAYNNKEMQDANFVELSRRGYVVLAIDQANHGNSDLGGTNGIATLRNAGVYEGVTIISRLPYVDKSRIGITGHSMGGMSCNSAVVTDNAAGANLIASVLLNCADAIYTDSQSTWLSDRTTGNFGNIYGNRDVGIISAVYDEFFHKSKDANGNPRSSPYFMETANAQSFLYFGADPAGLKSRVPDTLYIEKIDGKDTVRIIYRPAIIHPWSHFSAQSTKNTIDFFEQTLGTPNPIVSTNQVWIVKEAFNFIGMIGFGLFIVTFTILMLFTPYFAALRSEEIVQPLQADTKGKLWFWGSNVTAALFAMLVYLPILTSTIKATFVKQTEPFAIACWAAVCGLFAILVVILFHNLHAKKRGVTLEDRGIKISLSKLLKTVWLAIIVAGVSYSWVFFADYFFKTDFRLWTLAFKVFNPNLLFISLFPYLPLLLIFFIPASMASNCFNYNQVGGKHGWVNGLIVSLFAGAPAIILLAIQYGAYFKTNHMAWMQVSFESGNPPMYILWLFPLVLVLPAATAISRWIYKVSRNPYLPGIINAIIVVLFACMNTMTNIRI